MVGRSGIVWTIGELTQVLRKRQLNKFDVNIGVSGKRGDGKSTLIHKIMLRFKKHGFKNEKHQVYSRERVMALLANHKFSFCWDDEAINSGYKRDFQNTGQKELIKMVTNYRDNFNLYASAIPSFYSLDKDLRDLIFLHIHIIKRGVAVILKALDDQIHSHDIWDTKNNMAIEKRENERIAKNPGSSFRYHLFSTFAGYLYYNDVTEKQRKVYQDVKDEGRSERFKDIKDNPAGLPAARDDFFPRAFKMLQEGQLTREGLVQMSLVSGRKFTSVCAELNRMLMNAGETTTLMKKLRTTDKKEFHNNSMTTINDVVPDLTP